MRKHCDLYFKLQCLFLFVSLENHIKKENIVRNKFVRNNSTSCDRVMT